VLSGSAGEPPSPGAGAHGLEAIPYDVAWQCLGILMLPYAAPRITVMPPQWADLLQGRELVPGVLLAWKQTRMMIQADAKLITGRDSSSGTGAGSKAELYGAAAAVKLREVAADVIGDVDPDTPLLEAGLDSLGALEFGTRVQNEIGQLPETLIYDYPTLRGLEGYVASRTPDGAAGEEQVEAWRKRQPKAGAEAGGGAPGAAPPAGGGDKELKYDWGGGAGKCIGEALWRLRPAPEGWDPRVTPRLVIMHSVMGDEGGYERFYQTANQDREVLCLRHVGLCDTPVDFSDLRDAQQLADRYARELIEHIGDEPFDMIGASLGGSLAHRCVCTCQEIGGNPRRLTMIDPPAPEPLPGLMQTMAGEFGMTFRQAAEVLLLMPTYLKSGDLAGREDGDPEGEAEKAAIRELVQKCRTLPEEALPYLVVKEGMSGLGMFKADSPIVEVAIVKATQRIKAFQHCVKILWGGWGGNDPPARHYRGPGGAPSIFLVKASERGEFFGFMMVLGLQSSGEKLIERRALPGVDLDALKARFDKYKEVDSAIAIFRDGNYREMMQDDVSLLGDRALNSFKSVQTKDVDGMHGPAALTMTMEGNHLDVTTRCISRRDLEFNYLADLFMAPVSAFSAGSGKPGAKRDAGDDSGDVEDGAAHGAAVARANRSMVARLRERFDRAVEQQREALLSGFKNSLKVCLPPPPPE